jgi:hypothetical protein
MRRCLLLLLACALAASAGGCALVGYRRTVDEAAARAVLAEAVALARSPQLGSLCQLSAGTTRSETSTCAETLQSTSALVPDDPPAVRCALAVGDVGPLRGGVVLVVEGLDANGDPYRTDFVVYDDGSGVGVLDAVWWSGLSIEGYGEDTVTWRFGSDSAICEDGGMPAV